MSSDSALNAMPRMPTVMVDEVVALLEPGDEVERQALVDRASPRGRAWKLLLLNAASCIVSLNRHGPAANPAPGRSAARG